MEKDQPPTYRVERDNEKNRAQLQIWINRVDELLERPPDENSKRARDVIALMEKFSTRSSLAQLQDYVKQVHKLVDKMNQAGTSMPDVLKRMDGGIQELQRLVPPPPDDESKEFSAWESKNGEKWDEQIDNVLCKTKLKAATLQSAPGYMKLLDVQKILGQIQDAYPNDKLVVLAKEAPGANGVDEAMAAIYRTSNTSLNILELTVSPDYAIAPGSRGAGTALMTYLVQSLGGDRKDWSVYLTSIRTPAANAIYKQWGFVSTGGDRMGLFGENLEEFLKKNEKLKITD